jgi:hypothetical protein
MYGSFVILSHVMGKLCLEIYPILNQSHTIPTFKWFPQYEVCPLAEVITNKFTMKMKYKIVVKKLLRTQSSNTLKSGYYIIEIIP